MASSTPRSARVFLSSTFRDFGEERDLMVRRVFPALRARLKDRFVELVDVDLRWGITAEQAERGEVLPICLAEIDRSRPFFVGLLGERYGWVPDKNRYPPELVEQRPWLAAYQGDKSVTELEILHGVLNDPSMAGRALFYFRSPAYARLKGGDYLPQEAADKCRQEELKNRIRASGFPVVEDYRDPQDLAQQLGAALWTILDEIYPLDEVPDAFTREGDRHEAYALPLRRLYLGREEYIRALDAALDEGRHRILVEGASGSGKSALLANWLERRAGTRPDELVHTHYLGATAEASDPQKLARRLVEAIKRMTGSLDDIPGDPQSLFASLPAWLGAASELASNRQGRFVIVLDSLNGLDAGGHDLRWLPRFLPERVHLIVSCLPGGILQSLMGLGDWARIEVAPLTNCEARELFVAYLRRYNKELPCELLDMSLTHPLSTNPLFLRTLAEELRLFGVHEQLKQRLEHYLQSRTMDDLFERVLERVEGDCGPCKVQAAMEGIWASRAGLSEQEIQGFAAMRPADWAPIRYAIDDSLLESGGRITFAHDYMRLAVSDRYMKGNNTISNEGQSPEALALRRKAHLALAGWFETALYEPAAGAPEERQGARQRPSLERCIEELPWQYAQGQGWVALREKLCDLNFIRLAFAQVDRHELLGYWNALEAHLGLRLEMEYQRSWAVWPEAVKQESPALSGDIQGLMALAGRFGPENELFARLSVEGRTNTLGTHHRYTVQALNALAEMFRARSDYSNALDVTARAVEAAEGLDPSEEAALLDCLVQAAETAGAAGKIGLAAEFFERALTVIVSNVSPGTVREAYLRLSAAWLEYTAGSYREAEANFRSSLDWLTANAGRLNAVTQQAHNNLGLLLFNATQWDEALFHLAASVHTCSQIYGENHWITTLNRLNLNWVYAATDRVAPAKESCSTACALFSAEFGYNHPLVALTNFSLGRLLLGGGAVTQALRSYRRAEVIYRTTFSEPHPDFIPVHEGLGWSLLVLGRRVEAKWHLRRAVHLSKSHYGRFFDAAAEPLAGLIVLAAAQRDFRTAEREFELALNTRYGVPDFARALRRSPGLAGLSRLTKTAIFLAMGYLEAARGNKKAALQALDHAISQGRQVMKPGHRDIRRLERLRQRTAGSRPLAPRDFLGVCKTYVGSLTM
jgi:nephrocystin-3